LRRARRKRKGVSYRRTPCLGLIRNGSLTEFYSPLRPESGFA